MSIDTSNGKNHIQYFRNGKLNNITRSISAVKIDGNNPLPSAGMYYIYIDSDDGTLL